MSLGPDDLRFLAECASKAALRAGILIAASRPELIRRKAGHSEASQVVTEVDQKAEDMILEALEPTITRFDLGVLSEERADDRTRLDKEFFWSIDPLDGTLAFIEDQPGYAVSIALVARNGDPRLGVIFAPAQNTLYRVVRGLGITCNEQPWTRPTPRGAGKTLSVFADRSLASSAKYEDVLAALEGVAQEMGLEGIAFHTGAGAAINACQVLLHAPACYFKLPGPHGGGGSLWDFAASACLFAEAGASATDIEGNALDLNRADSTFMNHRGVLFASDAELARRVQALARALFRDY